MKLTVDLTPLLIRSAGVKGYLYYWYRALLDLPGASVTGFPFLDEPGALRHEGSNVGLPHTLWSIAYLHVARKLPRPFMGLACRGCDVFHATNQVYDGPRGARLTTTLHDVTSWLTPEVHLEANRVADARYAERILKRADGIIAVSENTRRDAINVLGLDPARITTIHSGVADAFFDPPPAGAVRRKYGLDKPYVLFVGTVEPRKNLDRLLDAWRGLTAEFELVIVGASGWAPPDTVRRLSETSGVRKLGYIPEAELPALTGGALAVAYPSLYEGFGFPVAQAMACGVPVLTSNVSSLPEIARDAAVFVDPQDTEAIRAGLRKLVDDAELRAALSKAGRKRAENYRWDRCARESMAFFARLI